VLFKPVRNIFASGENAKRDNFALPVKTGLLSRLTSGEEHRRKLRPQCTKRSKIWQSCRRRRQFLPGLEQIFWRQKLAFYRAGLPASTGNPSDSTNDVLQLYFWRWCDWNTFRRLSNLQGDMHRSAFEGRVLWTLTRAGREGKLSTG